jgi:hypothetical protein
VSKVGAQEMFTGLKEKMKSYSIRPLLKFYSGIQISERERLETYTCVDLQDFPNHMVSGL